MIHSITAGIESNESDLLLFKSTTEKTMKKRANPIISFFAKKFSITLRKKAINNIPSTIVNIRKPKNSFLKVESIIALTNNTLHIV
jgi:hypothetical protein